MKLSARFIAVSNQDIMFPCRYHVIEISQIIRISIFAPIYFLLITISNSRLTSLIQGVNSVIAPAIVVISMTMFISSLGRVSSFYISTWNHGSRLCKTTLDEVVYPSFKVWG